MPVATLEGRILAAPELLFDAALTSQVHTGAYKGMRRFGPFDASRVNLTQDSILFVFPNELHGLAQKLAVTLRTGKNSYPGFSQLFKVPLTNDHMTDLRFDADLGSPSALAQTYRDEIVRWNETTGAVPQLAMVLVPHSERWETDRPYYAAKSAFARLGIPTQMVTNELLDNEREFTWSVANVALAAFAKLGGVPWCVTAPAADTDLVIGVGRADVRDAGGTRRIFGYALSFVSNGLYQHTWSSTPAADEDTYLAGLEESVAQALLEARDTDEAHRRLVVHLTKRTGWREIEAVRAAMGKTQVSLPAVFLRMDDSTLYDLADGGSDHLAPPKGLAVRLSERSVLLQSEGLTAAGPPQGPLLIEVDRRSDFEPAELDELTDQTYRLAFANWRAFNARSSPVTAAYGEYLAKLVGYLEQVEGWDPQLLRGDLRERPWFL